jgi:HSP20 family molecular chaperone IbpA
MSIEFIRQAVRTMTDITFDCLEVTPRLAGQFLEDVRYYYKPYEGMGIGFPPREVEITEESDELIVSIDAPRLVKESISAKIVENGLYINADRKVRRRDMPSEELVRFYRRILLPYRFEDVEATATYEEGALRVRIPHKGTGTIKLK